MTEYKVVQNQKYGDYRVVLFVDGIWSNEFDGGWSESQAKVIAKRKADADPLCNQFARES